MSASRAALSALALGLVIGACASRPKPVEPLRPAALPKAPRPVAPSIAPADYVAAAGAIDLYVIKASEMALQRSLAARIQEVATRLIGAHQGSSAQLSFGGRRLNLLPSGEIAPRFRALLQQLAASSDFDREYARQMKAIHDEATLLHSNYALSGTSPTLVPIAKALAPVMEQQRRLVSYL